MTRTEMMDNVIKVKGFENDTVIMFCKIAENQNISKEIVEIAYETIMKRENKKFHGLNNN
ncbi:hypothetical protein [Megamonas funiformis]|uniref:hypothetical protein n=1 Tax=Megamonas funiformis TaxID=437897 RepID=UPI003F87FFCE